MWRLKVNITNRLSFSVYNVFHIQSLFFFQLTLYFIHVKKKTETKSFNC